jgi:hypothetical protein
VPPTAEVAPLGASGSHHRLSSAILSPSRMDLSTHNKQDTISNSIKLAVSSYPVGFSAPPARGFPPHPRQLRPPQWPVIRRMSTPPTETSYDHRLAPPLPGSAAHPSPTRAVARVGRPHSPARRAAGDETKGSTRCSWLCWPGYLRMSGCPLLTCSPGYRTGPTPDESSVWCCLVGVDTR